MVDCSGFMGIAAVRKLCGKYGAVDTVRVVPGRGGYTTGLSVVALRTEEDAVAVFDRVNGRNLNGIKVTASFIENTEVNGEGTIHRGRDMNDRLASMDCLSLGFMGNEKVRVFVLGQRKRRNVILKTKDRISKAQLSGKMEVS